MLSFRIICLILIIAVPSCSRTPPKKSIERMSVTKLCAAATLSGWSDYYEFTDEDADN